MPKGLTVIPRLIHSSYNKPDKLKNVIELCKDIRAPEVQLCPSLPFKEQLFLSREEIPRRMRELKRTVRAFHREGIEVSINVLRIFMPGRKLPGRNPIGFRQCMVDLDGQPAPFHPCPLDPGFLDWVDTTYEALGGIEADKILVDDDFRLASLGGGTMCFCPLHLEAFRKRTGHRLSRDKLVAACKDINLNRIKSDYIAFKRETLIELAGRVREAVHRTDPSVRVGLMLTSPDIAQAEGRDMRAYVNAFAGPLRPLCRPGEGWYSDDPRTGLLKGIAGDVLYELSRLDPSTEIQAEVDGSHHTAWSKSDRALLEYQIRFTLVCGVKTLSLWAWHWRESVDRDNRRVRALKHYLRAHQRVARKIPDRTVLRGPRVVYSEQAGLFRSQSDLGLYKAQSSVALWRLGLPFTYGESNTAVLSANSGLVTREEALLWLDTHNVLVDAAAAARLDELGLADRLGLKRDGTIEGHRVIIEKLTRDRRNGEGAGQLTERLRSLDQPHWVPVPHGARPLGHILDLDGKRVAGGTFAFAGGKRRAAVLPFEFGPSWNVLEPVRQAQLHSLLAWLQGAPPAAAIVEADLCPVVLEETETGVLVVSVVNASTQRGEDFVLRIRQPAYKRLRILWADDRGRWKPVPGRRVRREDGVLAVRMRGEMGVDPLSVRTLRVEPA